MKISFLIALSLLASQELFCQAKVPSHSEFNKLLQKNVNKDGRVNYRAFINDSTYLNQYLNSLSANPPDPKTWSKQEQIAYWINAYNAFTIKLISKYYPLKSIRDIGSSIQVPFVNTPWDIKFIVIGKERMDLNNIEHGILRKKFDDPRIHMALVCASKSCPMLLNNAYDPAHLDDQLTKQTKTFLNDAKRNKITADLAQLSMIFKWYNSDFTKNGSSVRGFINRYSEIQIRSDAKITYNEYDWSLNE